jgi:hypothetical protein
VCDWKGEAIEGGFRASSFKPGGVLVGECDDDQFIRREGAKRVFNRFHGVGITDPGLNVVGRCRLRELVGPLGCVGAGVVLGVCQPVEPGYVGGWRATTAPRSSLLRTVELLQLDARAQISHEPVCRQPAIGEPVSPTERSSAWRSIPRAWEVEKRADEGK